MEDNKILYPEGNEPTLNRPYRRRNGDTIVYTHLGATRRIDDSDPSVHGRHLLGYEGEQGIYVHYRPAAPEEIQALDEHSQRVKDANETLFPAYKAAHDALRSALFRTAGAANGAHIFASILPVLGHKYTNESVKAELDAYWAAKDAYEAAIQWRTS